MPKPKPTKKDASVIDEDNILEVDIYSLEKEWAKHPKRNRLWSKKLAKAQLRLDEAKDAHKLVVAELGKSIREDPEAYDLSKVTDKAVEQYIPLQDEYKASLTTINEAKYKVAMIESMVSALEDKRRALENEVKLFALQYFELPNVSQNIKDAFEMEDATRAYRGKKKRPTEDDE